MSTASFVLERVIAAIDNERLGAYGVHVLIGDDEAQHRWRSDDRENIYSASKGVCAIAIGMAIGEGILSLETSVPELLPSMELGAGVEAVTIRHLLKMSSGIDFAWFGDERVPGPDLAQEMLRRQSHGAGAVFQYSDASTYVAMRMLGAAVGDVRDGQYVIVNESRHAVVTITAHEESRDHLLAELAAEALTVDQAPFR